jgi:hypothetical protein
MGDGTLPIHPSPETPTSHPRGRGQGPGQVIWGDSTAALPTEQIGASSGAEAAVVAPRFVSDAS